MRKGFLAAIGLSAFGLFSCATTSKENLTPKLIDTLVRYESAGKVSVEKSMVSSIKGLFSGEEEKTPAQKLQYYVSSKVTYRAKRKEDDEYIITKDGKLIKADEAKDKVFIIYEDTLGSLDGKPEKRDGRYVVTVTFSNAEVEFAENESGLFSLTEEKGKRIKINEIEYETTDDCTLQYLLEQRKNYDYEEKSARGKKIRN